MNRLRPLFLLLAAAALLAGCASTKNPDVGPNGEAVSTTPWNKPASWEGAGALGGVMGH